MPLPTPPLARRRRTPAVPTALALLALLAPGRAPAAAPAPTILVTQDNTVITQSCTVVIRDVIADPNHDGVIHIGADNITVRFAPGTSLRGAPAGAPWDQLQGIGVRIQGRRNVVLHDLRVHGFRNGLVATDAEGLEIDGGDFSDNYRQHLKSTPDAENGEDWLYPHNNDETRWRDQYGGAVCVESSDRVSIHGIRVRRGQNGILLDRVNGSSIYDNDCSFLSGWGLALWRSSTNRVTRNAFDFCVRGHAEGVYNRGQDSAGILCFEQSSDNLFAENSATHGGDCFFGFAGQEAIGERWIQKERARLRKETGKEDVDALIRPPAELVADLSARGCNRNLLVGNDFSYSPAHGIEMTFSEGNRFIRNRLVENAICGVWGGYSSRTWIAENEFTANGGMAYGLERGAINMEHAADNVIVGNRFLNNKCAVHLWWDDDGALLKYPGVAGNERGVTGNVIAGNQFEINADAPFRALRPEVRLLVLQIRDTSQGHVSSNAYFGNTVVLTHPQSAEFAVKAGAEPSTAPGRIPRVEVPKYRALGRTHPVGARASLRGRSQIVMGEWGPWDHESPMIRAARAARGERAYDLAGLAGEVRATVVEGNVSAELQDGTLPGVDGARRLVIRPRQGVSRYRVRVSADGFVEELGGVLVATEWQVRLFPWKVDPREDLAAWRKLADGPDAKSAVMQRLDLPFAMGGPRDLKLSGDVDAQGPGPDHFGLIARTALRLPAGRWRFRTQSDDGVRVLVDGRPVIENWTWHGPTSNEGVFEQKEEREVPIVVEYFEIDGYAILRLDIEPL